MSAKAETLAPPARPIASYVLAIVLTLAIGAAAGSLITQAVTSDTPVVAEQVVGITPWDQQKLDAMAGRQQAETVEVDGPGIAPWDQGKLDAMAGFQASAGGARERVDPRWPGSGRSHQRPGPRRPSHGSQAYGSGSSLQRDRASRVSLRGVVRERGVARPEADVGVGRPSLAELYEREAPGAVRLAYLLTGDRAVAEDITQDAFVRVSGRLAHLREGGAFDAYLRRAVVNLAKNHFRRRAVERAFLERTPPGGGQPRVTSSRSSNGRRPWRPRTAPAAPAGRDRPALLRGPARGHDRRRSCGVATAPFAPS